ncbi:DUF1738 domain-containing protein [Serratia fonticola]|uniref:ArdC family protein n=1 Tax=Serratia fonticola TaxID=47917 RepID=UPI00192B1993|nr:zincin-like metallopeptidase domain-containing protein [Serratia fonticola]MBL5862094.1 DUF1738 domain-containing protein [Serratia fonticola]
MKKSLKKSSRSHKDEHCPKDVYQDITDRIILALENGTIPWRKPWRVDGCSATPMKLPCNAVTERSYNGVNVLLLWMTQLDLGFTSHRWLTFKQAKEAGGNVRKGESSTRICCFRPFEKQVVDSNDEPVFDDDGNPQMRSLYRISAHQVFNVEQCEGLPESILDLPESQPSTSHDELQQLDPLTLMRVQAMTQHSGVKVIHRAQTEAYYNPFPDVIALPETSQFLTEADYWSTRLHELVHSTGHIKRLNREGITSSQRRFGCPIYAFEELVAEIGSAFLCADLKVIGEVQHESYIDGWLTKLKEDKKAIFRAARQAREAVEYLLSCEQLEKAA